jgi:hypothetical protein
LAQRLRNAIRANSCTLCLPLGGANAASADAPRPPPAAPPAYHAGYDRTPGVGPGRTGPPDGSVAVQDIALVVAQFGHSCL